VDRGPSDVWGDPPYARSWILQTWEVCSFTCDTGETYAVEAFTRVREAPQNILVPLFATSQSAEPRAQIAERRAQSPDRRAQIAEPRAQSADCLIAKPER
jgi:hypothetical protein